MSKKKRAKEKELLEQKLLRNQIRECIANIILAIVSIISIIVTAILGWFN